MTRQKDFRIIRFLKAGFVFKELLLCKEKNVRETHYRIYFVGLSLLLKTLPWCLIGQSEGKTIRFHLFILELITDIQKKWIVKSASQPVKWIYLLLPFVKSALYHGTSVLSQRPNFLIPTLLFVARTDQESVVLDRGLPFLQEGTWVDAQVCVWHERWQHIFSGMLTWEFKNSAVVWNLIV